jgi:hypothetical protein
MKYSYNIFILIFIFIFTFILTFTFTFKKLQTGFQNYSIQWSPDLIKRFNIYQQSVNQNINQYDLTQLQRQATPEEAEELLKTGFWPWPNDLKQLYIEKVSDNPIIKIEPQYALNYAMKLYNKNAVTELLAWNTKEGHFLLYGAHNNNNTIKCSPDSIMQKNVYTGINNLNYKTNVVQPEDISKEIPGFSFVKGTCNPCLALNADFSCPFKLNIEGDDSISEPWNKLWNL